MLIFDELQPPFDEDCEQDELAPDFRTPPIELTLNRYVVSGGVGTPTVHHPPSGWRLLPEFRQLAELPVREMLERAAARRYRVVTEDEHDDVTATSADAMAQLAVTGRRAYTEFSVREPQDDDLVGRTRGRLRDELDGEVDGPELERERALRPGPRLPHRVGDSRWPGGPPESPGRVGLGGHLQRSGLPAPAGQRAVRPLATTRHDGDGERHDARVPGTRSPPASRLRRVLAGPTAVGDPCRKIRVRGYRRRTGWRCSSTTTAPAPRRRRSPSLDSPCGGEEGGAHRGGVHGPALPRLLFHARPRNRGPVSEHLRSPRAPSPSGATLSHPRILRGISGGLPRRAVAAGRAPAGRCHLVGGSLGGNLSLRLDNPVLRGNLSGATRPLNRWIRRHVAWSPASVWASFGVGNDFFKDESIRQTRDNSRAAEVPEDRRKFFDEVFFAKPGGALNDVMEVVTFSDFNLPAPSETWYSDEWGCKAVAIQGGVRDIAEVYCEQYRRWHWRVAFEQLLGSFTATPFPVVAARSIPGWTGLCSS